MQMDANGYRKSYLETLTKLLRTNIDMAGSRKRSPKTTVSKELRKVKAKKRKDLERLAVKLAAESSEETRADLISEIEEIGQWYSDAKSYGRSQMAQNAHKAQRISAQNKKSGLSSTEKREVSGGGGPGTGKRR